MAFSNFPVMFVNARFFNLMIHSYIFYIKANYFFKSFSYHSMNTFCPSIMISINNLPIILHRGADLEEIPEGSRGFQRGPEGSRVLKRVPEGSKGS